MAVSSLSKLLRERPARALAQRNGILQLLSAILRSGTPAPPCKSAGSSLWRTGAGYEGGGVRVMQPPSLAVCNHVPMACCLLCSGYRIWQTKRAGSCVCMALLPFLLCPDASWELKSLKLPHAKACMLLARLS